MLDDRAAMVLFSGGQDSTTCLAWALNRFDKVATVGFDYGQRHRVELECRMEILAVISDVAAGWKGRLSGDVVLNMHLLHEIGGTAMTEVIKFEQEKAQLPNTFVPGRNLLFMVTAAACAYRQGIRHLITGVCETDYSGYPDCRDDTMKAIQVAINLGTDQRFVIHTPLMWVDKAATWQMAKDLGGERFVNVIVEKSHTCYQGDRTKKHAWGFGCDECPACKLRRSGHERFLQGETFRSAE